MIEARLRRRAMIRQVRLQNAATRYITDKSRSGRLVEGYYCERCWEAKYVSPPTASPPFSTPKFTLKNVMILLGAWTVWPAR
jgi:hypothetical protein